jgi:hypothetical protein
VGIAGAYSDGRFATVTALGPRDWSASYIAASLLYGSSTSFEIVGFGEPD